MNDDFLVIGARSQSRLLLAPLVRTSPNLSQRRASLRAYHTVAIRRPHRLTRASPICSTYCRLRSTRFAENAVVSIPPTTRSHFALRASCWMAMHDQALSARLSATMYSEHA